MPPKKYSVVLTPSEKWAINIFLQEKENCYESIRRAKILLELNESDNRTPPSVKALAQKHKISENSIRRIRKKFACVGLGNTLKHFYNPVKKQHNKILTPKIEQRIIYYHFKKTDNGKKCTSKFIADTLVKEDFIKSISPETVRRFIKLTKSIPKFYNMLKWLYYKQRFEDMENMLALPLVMKQFLYRDKRYYDKLQHIPDTDYYKLVAKLYDDTFFHSGEKLRYLLKNENYVQWSFQMWGGENIFIEERVADYIIDELIHL